MSDHKHSLIMVVVKRGFADIVMEAAKSEGARGGTVIHARGTSTAETQNFMGISIEPEKDLLLILVNEDKRTAIMKAINDKAGLNLAGNGLIFAVPVDEIIGKTTLPDGSIEDF